MERRFALVALGIGLVVAAAAGPARGQAEQVWVSPTSAEWAWENPAPLHGRVGEYLFATQYPDPAANAAAATGRAAPAGPRRPGRSGGPQSSSTGPAHASRLSGGPAT